MTETASRKPAKIWLRRLPAAIWMILIFLLSHQPGPASGETSTRLLKWLQSIGIDLVALFGDAAGPVLRKTAHFTEYFILCLLLHLALRSFRKTVREGSGQALTHAFSAKKAILFSWIGAAFYAATDEFHQLFVPFRTATVTDVLIDSSGALLAALLLLFLAWQRQTRK